MHYRDRSTADLFHFMPVTIVTFVYTLYPLRLPDRDGTKVCSLFGRNHRRVALIMLDSLGICTHLQPSTTLVRSRCIHDSYGVEAWFDTISVTAVCYECRWLELADHRETVGRTSDVPRV
jgi:hypothetical protein